VRAGLTNDMADLFLAGMRKQTEWLESLAGTDAEAPRGRAGKLPTLTDLRPALGLGHQESAKARQ
jgi:hypothetical protein